MSEQVEMTLAVPAFVREFFELVGPEDMTVEQRASHFMWAQLVLYLNKEPDNAVWQELSASEEATFDRFHKLMESDFNERVKKDPNMLVTIAGFADGGRTELN